MKIFLMDTEFLSWSKKQSFLDPQKRSSEEPPELIQIFLREIFTKKKNQLLLYIKPNNYHKYPYRISKLTGIRKSYLNKNGINFKTAYHNIVKFLPSGSVVITNGNEYKILNINIKINKILKKNKKIFFLNFHYIIKNHILFKIYKKLNFITISEIKKILKTRIKNHNAKNDVKILYICLKKIKFKKKDLRKYNKLYKIYKI